MGRGYSLKTADTRLTLGTGILPTRYGARQTGRLRLASLKEGSFRRAHIERPVRLGRGSEGWAG